MEKKFPEFVTEAKSVKAEHDAMYKVAEKHGTIDDHEHDPGHAYSTYASVHKDKLQGFKAATLKHVGKNTRVKIAPNANADGHHDVEIHTRKAG